MTTTIQYEYPISLEDLFAKIEADTSSKLRVMYQDHRSMFETAAGSKFKHHAWKGGYLQHVNEVMSWLCFIYDAEIHILSRDLQYSLSDSLIGGWLHDLEKPWKYGGNEEKKNFYQEFVSEYGSDAQKQFTLHMLNQYDIKVSDDVWNGLIYAHGEGHDYHPMYRRMGSLAAMLHASDVRSARVHEMQPIIKNEKPDEFYRLISR